ncbi:50S ribosomal protein L18 [Posidoniimonas polymericola]|uniref:Large ribosomal subunit protein uL18 n=1 Tax=Posidoniimonas polymericola TaxID=2528002 RepID=A0A5C5YGJ9_9BACT|nr:50S ribosomal protein L18 [Posidoniimonas polymericola]TWT73671.1 50S ribosomal protein L18 [Posidoniimonas polymericola]
MDHSKAIGRQRKRRSFRVRKRLRGTAERPRLSVSRSHKNIAVQLIDDDAGKTIASASTLEKSIADQVKFGGNRDAAAAVGKAIAERAAAAGVNAVCFDRGPYKYHGRVADLAGAAREAGLQF